MTIAIQNKVQQRIRTDEGWLFIFNTDFAEGGTPEEAEVNLRNGIAVAKRMIKEAQKTPYHYVTMDNFEETTGLN